MITVLMTFWAAQTALGPHRTWLTAPGSPLWGAAALALGYLVLERADA